MYKDHCSVLTFPELTLLLWYTGCFTAARALCLLLEREEEWRFVPLGLAY